MSSEPTSLLLQPSAATAMCSVCDPREEERKKVQSYPIIELVLYHDKDLDTSLVVIQKPVWIHVCFPICVGFPPQNATCQFVLAGVD